VPALTALVALASCASLLAQAPRETSGTQGEVTEAKITAKPGDGIKITAGDTFSLALLSWVQPQYRFLANDSTNPASNAGSADTSSFRIKRARTRMSGNLFSKDIEYRLMMEWVEGTAIKDAWLRWCFWRNEQNAVWARFGQQKTLYGRESAASDYMLDFVDRALATNHFSNSRSRGILFGGDHMEGKLHWTAGSFNTDVASSSTNAGEETANPDNELNYVFGIRVDPNGDMGDESYSEGDLEGLTQIRWTVGAGLQLGNHRATIGGATRDVDGRDLNIHGAFKLQGFHVLGEVFLRSDEPDVTGSTSTDSTGWQVGGTYTLPKQEGKDGQLAVGGRFSMITLDDAAQSVLTGTPLGAVKGDVSELTALVGYYYKAHKLKAQASWTLQNVNPDVGSDATNHIFEVQLQFLF